MLSPSLFKLSKASGKRATKKRATLFSNIAAKRLENDVARFTTYQSKKTIFSREVLY